MRQGGWLAPAQARQHHLVTLYLQSGRATDTDTE